MSEADLIQALLSVQADIDTQFQFWTSITFAVLVASFVGADKLTARLRVLIMLLYLSASTVFVLRYLRGEDYFGYVMNLFVANDLTPPARAGRPISISQARWFLFIVGSFATAVFVLIPQALKSTTETATHDV